MPDWYPALLDADRAGMPLPDFLALPVAYQEIYRTARVAEREAEVS